MSRYNYREIARTLRLLSRNSKSKAERKVLKQMLWHAWRVHRGFDK